MSEFELEIQETESLLATATYTGVKNALQTHLSNLKKALAKANESKSIENIVSKEPTISIQAKPSVLTSTNFIPVEDFAWDQGAYNSPNISIFVELEDVGSIKDNVSVSFTKQSFDLKVMDLKGKNYRLIKDNLEKDIIPEQSSFTVKKNKVVIKLQKVKGEYSYDHWASLTAKKKREEADTSKKDPMGGIMDMMKNMYEEGDENMKKIIGEAMLKSQRGEKPTTPSLDELNA